MKTGYIRFIDNKVKFEYYQLYKPDKKDYYHSSVLISNQLKLEYLKDYKEYEASKRVIKVENDCFRIADWALQAIKAEINNQPCEAEVENNIATIIKINQ